MLETIDLTGQLLEVAREVLGTMAGLEVRPADGHLCQPGVQMVLSSITFTGQIEGCLGITCQVASAKAIAAGMLGLDPDQPLEEQEVKDALGEVANMLMGSLKARLLASGLDLAVSIPSVVTGKDLEVGLVDGFEKADRDIVIGQGHCAHLYVLYRQCE